MANIPYFPAFEAARDLRTQQIGAIAGHALGALFMIAVAAVSLAVILGAPGAEAACAVDFCGAF